MKKIEEMSRRIDLTYLSCFAQMGLLLLQPMAQRFPIVTLPPNYWSGLEGKLSLIRGPRE